MLKRLGLVFALAASTLAAGCDPCSIACLLCLAGGGGGGGGQASVAPGSGALESPQLKAIAAHAADVPVQQRY